MINVELTLDELNTIIQGLSYLEDIEWFTGNHKVDQIIQKLNKLQAINETVCDI